jgi:hypothetical protein
MRSHRQFTLSDSPIAFSSSGVQSRTRSIPMSFEKTQALINARSAAPPRRTRPLRQGRTQDELKEQRAKSKLAEVRREKDKVSSFGYLVFSPPAPGEMTW